MGRKGASWERNWPQETKKKKKFEREEAENSTWGVGGGGNDREINRRGGSFFNLIWGKRGERGVFSVPNKKREKGYQFSPKNSGAAGKKKFCSFLSEGREGWSYRGVTRRVSSREKTRHNLRFDIRGNNEN